MTRTIDINVDAGKSYQTIDGFGVNINPAGYWRDGRLIPVLDLLIHDLGATLFRLDPYGFTNWVDPDDSADRAALNPETYARSYRSGVFLDAWAMARYLNLKGLEPLLNVSGIVPRWMCGGDGKTLTDLEAYADILASLARWAKEEEGVRFHLFGPFNETDIGPPEGPLLDAAGAARVLCLLADRFAGAGLAEVKFVVADQARFNLDYLRAIAAEPRLRDWVGVAGMHCYGDFPLAPVRDFLAANDLGAWRYWLTEYGDLDQTGEREWEAAAASARRLLRGLNDGVQAALAWDAYDNFHGHNDTWSIYGLLRVSVDGYRPKKRYHAAKQVYRFVPPGSVRIEAAAGEDFPSIAAFRTPEGDVTLVGLVEEEAARLEIRFRDLAPRHRTLRLYLTDREADCEPALICPWGERLRVTAGAGTIFTLTTLPEGEGGEGWRGSP